MAVEVFIHKMSEHMETARIVRWLVSEGEWVEKHQVIMEVETDKVVADFEAPASGILKGIRPGAVEGAEVPVGETIAFIAGADEEVPVLPPLSVPSASTPVQGQPVEAVRSSRREEGASVRATPVARRVARELGVDLAHVIGTGPEGCIIEEDVRRFAAERVPFQEDGTWLELTPAERTLGRRMLESVRTVPQFALTVSVDMSEALRCRERMMEDILVKSGERLSITALVVKAVAETLQDHPRVKGRFVEGRIFVPTGVAIAVAVAGRDGLVVPVIREAHRKSLAQINREIAEFQRKAQTMRFDPAELAGGVFTVSNLGPFGIERFTAIVNPPESAILAVGQIVKKPVALPDDTVGVRAMMALTLSADHRVLDGVQAARFLVQLRQRLEAGIRE